jgi:hypothetical protein
VATKAEDPGWLRSALVPVGHLQARGLVDNHTRIEELGEGCLRAVCSCGWHSPIFGADKTTGTMDPLQQASDAVDLHEWDTSLR